MKSSNSAIVRLKSFSRRGHAAGHVCFFFRDGGLLLAGDHVLPYIAPSLSPNIYDEIFQPLKSYLESLTVIEKLPITPSIRDTVIL